MRLPRLRRRQAELPDRSPGEVVAYVRATPEDETSFLALHRAAHGRFVRHVARFVGREEARDIVADAMAILWTRWPSLPAAQRVDHYAYGIVKKCLYLQLRTTRPEVELEEHEHDIEVASVRAEEEAVVEAHAAERDARVAEVFERVVAAMPRRRREVMLLIHEHGLSYRDAAEELGMAKGSVSQHMGHALRVLRDALVRVGIRAGHDVLKLLPGPDGGRAP